MGRKIKIEIPVIAGSNGKWHAYGHDTLKDAAKDADWGFMAENLDSSGPKDKESIWPSAEKRFVVTAEIEIPDAAPVAVDALAVSEVK